MTAAFALLLIALPALVLVLVQHVGWARRIGAIVLCYLAGLLLGNSGLLSREMQAAATPVSEVAVMLALPMLLFTLDVRAWRHLAGRALLSMVLAVTAVVAIAVALFFVFRGGGVTGAHEFAALAVGVYSGGTPNLAAIKTGLQIADARYLLFHSSDVLVGGLYLLFMLTWAKPLSRRLLPRFDAGASAPRTLRPVDADEDYRPLLRPRSWASIAQALGLSVLIVALSVGASQLLPASQATAAVILLVTTLSLVASLFERVRRLAHAYQAGMYLIFVFSLAVASMARLDSWRDLDPVPLLFVFGAVAGSLVLHALLCRLLRVDADTFMVTSVAAICSPPFVPMIAKTLNNPEVMLSGITAGILGYAVGNYAGITLGLMLARLAT